MTRARRLRATFGVLAALALAIAACGGAEDPNDTAPDQPAPDDPGHAEPAPDDPGMTDPMADMSEECVQFISEMTAAQNEAMQAASTLMTGAEADHEAAAASLQAVADTAPPEIQADFQVVADELGTYLMLMADLDFEIAAGEQPTPEQLEELAEIEGELDEEALQEATVNIDTYFNEEC